MNSQILFAVSSIISELKREKMQKFSAGLMFNWYYELIHLDSFEIDSH